MDILCQPVEMRIPRLLLAGTDHSPRLLLAGTEHSPRLLLVGTEYQRQIVNFRTTDSPMDVMTTALH